MQRLLLTIERCRPFGWDVCLAPTLPTLPLVTSPHVTLQRPDGTSKKADIYFVFYPHREEEPFPGHLCFLENLCPADVPPGTQVWVKAM
jgi:hypothetical protein